MTMSAQASLTAAARQTGLVLLQPGCMICSSPKQVLHVAVYRAPAKHPLHSRPEAVPASLDLKGFHTRYSVLSMVPGSVPGFCTLTRFSPYTLSPVRPDHV